MDADDYEVNMEENVHDLELMENPSLPPRQKKPAITSGSHVASSANQTNRPNKRKLTSSVWSEMVKKTIDGEEVAICNHCEKRLKAVSKNGTKHLHNHLMKCIQRNNQKDIRQCLLSMERNRSESDSSSLTIGNWTFNQETARQKLAKAIIVHEYPISIVEHEYFREYVESIQPLIQHWSRSTIRKEIFGIYNVEKEILKPQLKGINSRVAVTTDLWTSNQKKGYMTITAHFIDNNWKLQSRILNFLYVPTPHTNENLAEGLFDSLMAWNLDRKLSTITVDNCSTNDAMIATLLLKLRKDDLILRGKILHMRCCAHILNLIVKDGVTVIESAIEKIRDSVQFWSATPSRVEKFTEACKQLDVSYNRKLSLDCKTRWNSTYDMLFTAIGYKEVFYRVQHMDRHYKSLPSDDDWELAEEICRELAIFYEVSNLFSGTGYPTANYYFWKVYTIRNALMEWKGSLDLNISVMAEKMFEKFEKYWGDVHVIMAICTVLDPRFKMKAVDFVFRKVFGLNASKEIQNVKDTAYELIQEYQGRSKSRQSKSSNGKSSPNCLGGDGGTSAPASTDPIMECYLEYLKTTTIDVHVKSELDHYLEEPVEPWVENSKFDILEWWKVSVMKYPTLAEVAKNILAIPVSTVASESAFSTGGRVISSHRSRLKADTIEALMCTQSWIVNKTIGTKMNEEEDENE